MPIPYVPINSPVPGRVPDPAVLHRGQLAVNLADRKIWIKDHTDNVVELSVTPDELYISPLEPADPATDNLWLDISNETDPYLKWYDPNSAEWVDVTGDSFLYKTADLDESRKTGAVTKLSSPLVIPDAMDGLYENTPTTSSGSGTGLTLDINITAGVVDTVTIKENGVNYAAEDIITVDAANFEGATAAGTLEVLKAETIYQSPKPNSGMVVRDDSKPDGDPSAYYLSKFPVYSGSKAPYDPHPGMIWVKTRPFLTLYVWTGEKWVIPDGTEVGVGYSSASYIINVDVAVDPVVTLTWDVTGNDPEETFIDWGDGTPMMFITTEETSASHTYAASGDYTVTLFLSSL
jgi:hypothetical protein